jgi:hypothetical protein
MPHHTPTDLPSADLVDAVAPHRFSRFTVGTGPFNAMAMVVLLAISGYVVMASSTTAPLRSSRAAADEVAAGPQRPVSPRPRELDSVDDTTTSSSTTTSAAPTTTAAPATTTTAPPITRKATPTPTARFVVRSIRCSDFPDQPTSQKWFDSNRLAFAGLDGDGDGTACEDLPGAPKAAAVPTAPLRALSKADLLRPNTRLFGVHTPQAPLATEVDAFATEAGKSPNMIMFFRDLEDPFPAEAIQSSWVQGRLPMVTLEPIVKDSTSGQPKLRDITSGKYDAVLTAWAKAAAAQDLAFVLRFGQEMNGNWYTWSDGYFGNARGDFVKAWRHVHDVFTANGASSVIWNWSVNRVDSLPDRSLGRVYPGDDYVDWVGVSGYYRTTSSTPSFDATFAMTLRELKRVAPSKLVILSEVGAGTTETNRVAWINDFFAKLLDHPEIIGFNWFNDFKSGGDWRIGYSTQTEAAFRAGVADARYGPLVP